MNSKVIHILLSAALFGFIACSGRSAGTHTHDHENCTEHEQCTHTHADGTVHSNHAPEQESFKVEADGVTAKADTVKHVHRHDGHDHSHDHH